MMDLVSQEIILLIQRFVRVKPFFPINREVEDITFDNLSPEAQFLVCKSSTLGPLIQYNSAGFLPNVRHHLAMGFAILDVAQVAHKHWKGGRSSKTNKKMSWREIFDVAVKWRRISDPEQPVFWLDMMPEKSVKAGFNFRMNLLRYFGRNGTKLPAQHCKSTEQTTDCKMLCKNSQYPSKNN
ncbi:PREDICTED: tetratricopeptide repeat protein 13-like [Acropora digitifera]|uniref:tetratricopeptide repeat protein 13-like n=1 Tax=Acropora digitifera TaxID=70779 RepID=UPI00077B219F|nr:PREDICTED: tetratricopeptide repeat protein 13-like [Acropora digitifera]